MGGIVSSIKKGSLAEAAGVLSGDEILSVNGHPLRDIIDYRFHSATERLRMRVNRNGEELALRIRQSHDEDLGVEFREALFDGVRTCPNKCLFCFVDQLPKGLRESVYLKDDDYRLSFLSGNFITLTNLTPQDFKRIRQMRLSPLYVSVHATDEAVRSRLLGRRRIPPIMEQLREFGRRNIRVHAQVVICPGINDGEILRKTVFDLASLFPIVNSVGIVPVGVTKFNRRAEIRSVSPDLAGQILNDAAEWQKQFRRRFDYPLVFAADELYLLAGRTFPPYASYADFPQFENGIGLAASFLQDLHRLRRRKIPSQKSHFTSATVVTGHAAAGLLLRAGAVISRRCGVELQVVPVRNRLFGCCVTVAGLLSGRDILCALRKQEAGNAVLVPASALNDNGLFLDNLRVEDLSGELRRPVFAADSVRELEQVLSGSGC